jgi:hypothetical protein
MGISSRARWPGVVALSFLAFSAPPASAQGGHEHQMIEAPRSGAAQGNRERYVIEAQRADKAPHIDGILDDPAWQSATVIDKFTQQEPNIGEPATERTEVRVVYDGGHLYIGVHAFDSQPGGVVATEQRRDADRLLDEDNFQVILDTFNDSRNGYMFVTTPLGAKLEQQISEEGENSGRGTNSNINRNWDGIWESAAHVTEDGWTAEISIPTTTLRFNNTQMQNWGINFMRTVTRKHEIAFWAPIPKPYTLMRVSLAGALTGLRSLSQGMDLKFKPFVVSGLRSQHTALSEDALRTYPRNIGFDAKYGVTSGLNLDVSYNTDFAQVEADEQQVNLTRFSLLFPEKRDFFLENAGMFNMGTGTSFSSTPAETDLLFTRRIGLSETGQPVPIVGGARLTGKVGQNTLAMLDMQTESNLGKPGDNFLVGRFSRDVLKRSRVGAIFINKESVGGSTHFNRTMGLDANLAVGRNLQVSSFVAKTSTPGLTGRDMAVYGRIAYRTPAWNLWYNYLDVQNNFNPEVGFVQRRGVKVNKAYFSPTPRPGKAHIRLMEPMLVVTYITDQSNRMVGRTIHTMLGTTLDDGSFINVIYQKNLDVLDTPFRIQPAVSIPIGTYNFYNLSLTYNTSPSKRLYERFSYLPQNFYGGTSTGYSAAVGFRATSALASELQYQRNDVKLPYGSFIADLAILRVDYAVSPRMTFRSLTQYNSSTHEVSNSLRYNFIYRPGSDLYVVYTDLQQTGLPLGALAPSDRQLAIKFTYLLAR